ncbi:MAG: hypothetical protein ACOH5I_15440 [Oligoflexus sp.]
MTRNSFAAEFKHEFSGSFTYAHSSGATESEAEDSTGNTAVKGSGIDLTMTYGYFLQNLAQPTIEVRYRSDTHKIGDLSAAANTLEFGFGVLFNVPIGQRDKDADPSLGRFHNAKYIPFGGVMLTKMGVEQSHQNNEKTSVTANEIVTKLVFGTRYLLYPNIALGSSIRTFYQSENTTHTVSDTEGGKAGNRLTVEARLISLSLLF